MFNHPNIAMILVALLAAVGIGLFVYNMFLAGSGMRDMRRIRKEAAAAETQRQLLEAARTRIETLRPQVKERFGKSYGLAVEPVDLLIGHAATALLANDPASALELLNEAAHEMEVLLTTSVDMLV